MKVWIDEYIRDAQITKNDGTTLANWICFFANPPYPLILEFRDPSNLHGIYTVSHPNTTPLIGSSPSAYGYEEQVPIDIYAVDSKNVSGEALAWAMQRELRYISQTYPEGGSVRTLDTLRGETISLGGDRVFHIETKMKYRRDTT